MTTTEELHTADEIGSQLVRLVRLLERVQAQYQAEHPDAVERAAYHLLAHLVQDGPRRASALAEAVHSDPSTVSRQVAGLVQLGYVERTADPEDGRATLLAATDEGRRVFEENRQARNRSLAELLAAGRRTTGWPSASCSPASPTWRTTGPARRPPILAAARGPRCRPESELSTRPLDPAWPFVVRLLAASGVLRPLPGGLDLALGVGPADPGGALDALARLEVLVDLEEVLDLQPVELGQVVDVAQVLLPRVVAGHAEDLVVAALLVLHPEHADRAGPDQAARERRLLDQHQRVQRVAVLAEAVLDEPVVGRVLGGGEQRPVQPDPAACGGPPRTCCGRPWGSRW